jgi:hypothetical protein
MQPSQPPTESPDKGEAIGPKRESTLLRFKRLTTHLFGVDRTEFQDALKKDEEERRAKRGR